MMKDKGKTEEEIPVIDFDSQWKDLITKYGEDFIKFFFQPKFVKTLDLTRGVDTNTEDLLKLFPDYGKKGNILPDKLFKVYEKNGKEGYILLHVEVEKKGRRSLPWRMFQYFMRLKERFPDAKITALVIYIGEDVPSNYNVYKYEFGGTKLAYYFNTYVVRAQSEEKLLRSRNPFALAVLACLYIIKAKKNYEKLLGYKLKLFRLCFEKGYSKQKIIDLVLFISFIVGLPKKKDDVYFQTIIPVMSRKRVPLIEQNPFAVRMLLGQAFFDRVEAEAEAKAEAKAKAKAEAEVRIRIAKIKAEAEIRAKAEAEIRAKAEAEIRAKAEAEIRAKAEAEIRAKAEKRAEVENVKRIEKINKFNILNMSKKGFEVDQIADILALDLEYVKGIVAAN